MYYFVQHFVIGIGVITSAMGPPRGLLIYLFIYLFYFIFFGTLKNKRCAITFQLLVTNALLKKKKRMALSCVLFDSLFVCLLAFVYSLMEIEMEGAYGWAKKLPTTKNVLGYALYHLYMIALDAALRWVVFVSIFRWTTGGCRCFSLDFTSYSGCSSRILWFVYNPTSPFIATPRKTYRGIPTG